MPKDGPEPSHLLWHPALLADAAHWPLAAIDRVILPLIYGRPESGRAHGERHQLGDISVRGTWEKFFLFGALTLGLVLLAWGVLIALGIL
jgi:hypothetical protein